MAQGRFIYPLGIQTVLPPDWPRNNRFRDDLLTLKELGFENLELNILDFEQVDGEKLNHFLENFGLHLTQFATGLTAKTRGLSLSSAEPQVRDRSIEQARSMIEFASRAGCGIIIGFLKGGPASDPAAARTYFRQALAQLTPRASELQVPILVEATNRYESAIANSLADAVDLILPLDCPYLRILPDTFHMNIEEADSHEALKSCLDHFDALHISDNNRFFPGFGAIDFGRVLKSLERIGFNGRLALEGNLKVDFSSDVRAATAYLAPLLALS